MMRTVYLEGELANKFGEKFTIEANSAQDVFKCLNVNFPTFKQYLVDSHEKGVGFTCQLADRFLESADDLLLKYGKGDMIVTPVPAGSKSAVGKIIAAIAIAIVVITNPAILGTTFSTGSIAAGTFALETAGMFLALGAVSLAMAGLSQMMAPDPSVDSGAQEESYVYQGTNQNGRIGDPIPVVYGQMRVPGLPIGNNIANSGKRVTGADGSNTDSLLGSGTGVSGVTLETVAAVDLA